MDPIAFLQSYSELAVALVGFSGIVVVLKHGGESELSLRPIAVSMLLGIGTLALICSVASQVLISAGIEQDMAWRIMSAFILAMKVVGATIRVRQAREKGSDFGAVAGRAVTIFMFCAVLVAATNLYLGVFWLFSVNLLIYIVVCTTLFANLLLPAKANTNE